MMPRHSFKGSPDLTPRTITSMELANSSRNLLCLRLIMYAIAQRGMPSAPTKAAARATSGVIFGADRKTKRAATRPVAPLAIQNILGVISRPARCSFSRNDHRLFGLLALLEVLQCVGDLLATALYRLGLSAPLRARHLGLCHTLQALLGSIAPTAWAPLQNKLQPQRRWQPTPPGQVAVAPPQTSASPSVLPC